MEWPESIFQLDSGTGLAVCVTHRGAHTFYLGGCQALPKQRAPYSEPLRRCQEDPSCRLAAGYHVHAPPTRVEVDVDSLAEAIVRASRATREERRPEQRARAAPVGASAPPEHEDADPEIPTVTVWSPDGGDGRGD